ncbi:KAT8 regulatory NSL complex subunit 1-like protein isoform X2 [Lithobates pipiens]
MNRVISETTLPGLLQRHSDSSVRTDRGASQSCVKLIVEAAMSPAPTESSTQETGVHFFSANLCSSNSKPMEETILLKETSSVALRTRSQQCLQKSYANSQTDCPSSPPYNSHLFLLNSGLNAQNKDCLKSKQESDNCRQTYFPNAERKVKRELFPGTVSQVLADVNKLWDLSVTEAEGMHGSPGPKYRLNGRIEGECLSIPLASNYSSPPDLTHLETIPQMLPNKESKAKSRFMRCLNQQQVLINRAKRNKKRLQMLLTNHVAGRCRQQISQFASYQTRKATTSSNILNPLSNTKINHKAADSSTVTSNICINQNEQNFEYQSPSQVGKFSAFMPGILTYFERQLDSDATGSSSDEDWDEKSGKMNNCKAECHWLSTRANIGSRWTWLQAKISELECQIEQLSRLQSQQRSLKSAQLTEMVSSLMTSFPVTPVPKSCLKSPNHEYGAAALPRASRTPVHKPASLFNGSRRKQTKKDRKSIHAKAPSTFGSSAARTRPLQLSYKRNLYRFGSGCTAMLSHKAVYCCNESLQTSNHRSSGTCCDKLQKPVLVKSNVCEIEPHFHPVLSLPSDLPLHLYLGALLKNREIRGDDVDNTHHPYCANNSFPASATPESLYDPRKDEKSSARVNDLVTLNTFHNAAQAEDNHTSATTPISQKSSFQTLDPSIVVNATRRRLRSESSFDIDNIVIPMNLVTPIKLEQLQYKEILTPSFKEMVYEPLEGPPDIELEDLSDEAYSHRHEKYEQEEKARWSFWQQNKCPKKNRSSSHGFAVWSGNIFSCNGEIYSPDSVSPVSSDAPSPYTKEPPNQQPLDKMQHDKVKMNNKKVKTCKRTKCPV